MGDQVVHSSCEEAEKLAGVADFFLFLFNSLNPHGRKLAKLRSESFSAKTNRWPFNGKRWSHSCWKPARLVNTLNAATSLWGFQPVGVKIAFSIVPDQRSGAMGKSKEQTAAARVEQTSVSLWIFKLTSDCLQALDF